MTRSTPADILAYLNTNWVVGTIAKPAYVDQFENEVIKLPQSLGVNWGSIEWFPMTTGFSSKDEERNTLTIQITSGTLAKLNTTIDHTRDLLKVKTLAGGHYQITSGNPLKTGSIYQCFLTLEEIMSLQ